MVKVPYPRKLSRFKRAIAGKGCQVLMGRHSPQERAIACVSIFLIQQRNNLFNR